MLYKNHYEKKKIMEINPETDSKVKIMGFVVDKKEDTLILDDGSGKVRVFFDLPSVTERIEINQLIRIFGSVVPTENGFDVKADIIQDLSGLDINLYKKVEELYNRMGV